MAAVLCIQPPIYTVSPAMQIDKTTRRFEMSDARPEPENYTDLKISDWIGRAKKLLDHESVRDYGEIKVADAEVVDELIGELVDDLKRRNAEYDEYRVLPWWNKISTAKVRGVTYNLTDLIEVLWLAQGKCGARMQPWLNFFMAKAQRAAIKSARQATTLPGQLKIRNSDRLPEPDETEDPEEVERAN
jgi:hypothetical protein